jgi:2-methylcitrate dehydratase PrpD
VPIVCEPRAAKLRPRTAYDAQFSLPYSVAASLIDGRVGLDTYAPARLGDPRVLELAARVTHAVDPDSRYPETFPGWVRVRLRDGRVLEARAPDGRGSVARPLPAEALVDKFRDNAGRALPPPRVAAIERAALRLDGLHDVRALTALCRVASSR